MSRVVTLTAQLQPAAQGATATAAQFRWIEPVGTGGNALGHSDNSAAYLPYLRVELCEIASVTAACGPVVPGSVATQGNGLSLAANGKAYAATLRAKDLPLDPARDYRLRVLLVDPLAPTAAGVQVGYQNVDVSAGGKVAAREGFYRITTKQSVPVKFILGPGIVRAVAITPALDTITIGTTRAYVAAAVDWEGHPVPGATATWLTADPAIADVSGAGVVSAASLGTTTLYATIDGVSASQQLRVITPVVSVTLAQSPGNPVPTGTTVTFTATAFDAAGQPVTTRPYTWQGAAGTGATATLTATEPGSIPVTVSVDGHEASLTVQVVPAVHHVTVTPAVLNLLPGQSATLQATAYDPANVVVPNRPVTWASANSGVAAISGAGLVTAGSTAGTSTTIVATIDGVSSSPVTVNVLRAPDRVELGASLIYMIEGNSGQATSATIYDGAVTLPIEDYPVTVTEEHASVVDAAISGNTLTLVPGAPGTSFVTVTVGGKSARLLVVVTPSTGGGSSVPTQLLMIPATVSLQVGEGIQLYAVPADASGVPVPMPAGAQLVWDENSAVVEVGQLTGLLSATSTGMATVTARLTFPSGTGTILGNVQVTVGSPPPQVPASIVVRLLPANTAITIYTLPYDSTIVLAAEVRDASGAIIPNVTVAWNAGANGVVDVTPHDGTVSVTGVRYSTTTATVDLTASLGSLYGVVHITVPPAAPFPPPVTSRLIVEPDVDPQLPHHPTDVTAFVLPDYAGTVQLRLFQETNGVRTPIQVTDAAWNNNSANLGSITQTGLVTYRNFDPVALPMDITVSANGLTGGVRLYVRAAP